MLNVDEIAMDALLCKLDEEGHLFPKFQLNKDNNEPRILGRGGYATVYEMRDKIDPMKKYALKVIGLEKHAVTLEGFWNSVRLQKKLCENSPYIMKVFDARALVIVLDNDGNIRDVIDELEGASKPELDGDRLHLQFILMEKLESIIAKDKYRNTVLLRDELRSETEIIKFAMQIGQSLMFAHANHILHRDIKLENIFWDAKEERYKLGDFDIAKYVEAGHAETIVYTDGYGAPEIKMRLTKSYNETTDIYSLGITLYLLLNDLVFPGSTGYFVNLIQYNSEFVFPAPKNASKNMTRIIRKMCSYRSDERYSSLAEVLLDLGSIDENNGADNGIESFEYPDVETETYRHSEESLTADDKNGVRTKTRAEVRLERKKMNAAYRKGCFRYYIILTLLFVLAMIGLQVELPVILEWGFWIVPAMILLTRDAVIIISYATAIGIWLLSEMTNGLSFLSFIADQNIGWILIILVIAEVSRLAFFKFESQKITKKRLDVELSTYAWICWLMILTGIVCKIQQLRGVWNVPAVVENIHFIRTGILSYVIIFVILVWCGYEEGETE